MFERGQSPGGRRYGYQSVKGEIGVLVIDAEEAAVVLRIFRLFVAGVSPKAIAKILNAEKIPGPRGPRSPSTIHGIFLASGPPVSSVCLSGVHGGETSRGLRGLHGFKS